MGTPRQEKAKLGANLTIRRRYTSARAAVKAVVPSRPVSSGCQGCSAQGGCESRKDGERELIDQLLGSLYPTRRWGEPDDAARLGRGVPERAGRRLARAASALLKAPAWYRRGDEHELCDWIYVLCVGRQPALYEVREAGAAAPDEGDQLEERYLRVALSSMGPVAAVQEVVFELRRADGLLHERPRAGVFDPILLARTQALVALLVESTLTYLDFGLVAAPPAGFDPGDYAARYGQAPGIVNYLFYPQPATAVCTTSLPLPQEEG